MCDEDAIDGSDDCLLLLQMLLMMPPPPPMMMLLMMLLRLAIRSVILSGSWWFPLAQPRCRIR